MVFAEFYAKKRNEGKCHRVALSHVSKKLITLNNVTSRGSSDERKEEKVENLMHNIKEQNRIDKLPDGEYKELEQSFFNLKKEIEKGL